MVTLSPIDDLVKLSWRQAAIHDRHWSAVEAMSRPDLRQLQEKLFQRQVRYIWESSAWYREHWRSHGVEPERITNLDDLGMLPFTSKADIRESQRRNPPYGLMLSDNLTQEDIVRIAMTSGTTGKPVLLPFTADDYNLWMEGVARALWSAGVRRADVVHAAFGFTPFIGLFGAYDVAERLIGATVIPGGAWDSGIRIQMLPQLGVTVLMGTPSYLLRLGRLATEQGHDLSRWPVRKLFVTGEIGPSSSPATGARLSQLWHADVHEFCGAQEINYFAWSCPHGGFHWNEDLVYPEVLDPRTKQPVAEGESGELVVTDLRQRTHPLIRFPTGDLVNGFEARVCPCERTLLHFKGFIGRIDDVVKIRGVSVAQSGIEHVLRSHEAVSDDYDIEFLHDQDGMDAVRIRAEPTVTLSEADGRALARELRDRLKQALMVSMEVSIVEKNTIPRFELKAKRVRDSRKRG